MGEIVNLRTVRRRRAREADAAIAADNRARFGRTASQADKERMEQAQAKRVLDNALLDRARLDETPASEA